MVSAPLLAKAVGVNVSCTVGDNSSVTITVSREEQGGGEMSMTGCVCGDKAFLTGKYSGDMAIIIITTPHLNT